MKKIVLKKGLIHSGNLILVNSQYPYQDNIASITLLPVCPTEKNILLEKIANKSLSCIMQEIDGWDYISAVSGWRSMREQEMIYSRSLIDNGQSFTEKYVAVPGHSEHQTGLAIDLGLREDQIDFICPNFPYTGICDLFRQKAIAYGYVERYPQTKEHITGIAHEPWHFRYVGVPHAEIMRELGITLEEYIAALKQYPFREKYLCYQKDNMYVIVSYMEANKVENTLIEIDEKNLYSVSGNNIDGFIITEWRN